MAEEDEKSKQLKQPLVETDAKELKQPFLEKDENEKGEASELDPKGACATLGNFIFFTAFFSTTTSANSAILAYNQVFFNSASSNIGSYASGTLYAFYMICPLFFAPLVIRMLGVKWAVFIGLVMYCYNVSAYPLASAFPAYESELLIGGAVIGGFAAGFLWAAQGTYFSRAATDYARQTGLEQQKAVGMFAAVFSFFYLIFEVGAKLVARPFLSGPAAGIDSLLAGYAAAAIVGCLGVMFVKAYKPKKTASAGPVSKKFVAAMRLLVTDPRVILLAPAQIVFQFGVEIIALYVANSVIRCAPMAKDLFPDLAYFAALIPLIAGLLQVPVGLLVKSYGRPVIVMMMVVGLSSFTALGFVVALVPRATIAGWGYGVVVLFVLQGIGRAAYEGANRATYANTFAEDNLPAAFSTMLLFGGLSGVICIFGFPVIPVNGRVPGSGGDNSTALCHFNGVGVEEYNGQVMGWITAGCGLLGLLGYVLVTACKGLKGLERPMKADD